MCGIFGIWNRDGRPVDVDALARATDSIRHRGPDDEGYLLVDSHTGRAVPCGGRRTAGELGLPLLETFRGQNFDLALCFRRLSILDLSPAGHQPMRSADGRQWLIFNGEIYNYRELRDELRTRGHAFHTGTDTEVILAAYQEWGRDCLSHFNGMWSFALWDSNRRELFVSRDRFGIKPLQYATAGSTFAFASELKALLTAGVVPFVPNVDAMVEYIALARMPSAARGDTFHEQIRSLPAAHSMVVRRNEVATERYWSIPASEPNGASDAALVEQYRELFDSAVRLHLRADVPTGTLLSGGLDSSSIVATANRFLTEARSGTDLQSLTQETFSAVYDDEGPWNERRFIDSVVAKTGVHPNFTRPDSGRLWRELDDFIWHHDEPVLSTSEFAEWCVMSLVKERGVTVVLVGQGADEIFGGYSPIFRAGVREALGRASVRGAWRMASALRSVDGANAMKLLASEATKMTARALAPAILRRVRERSARRNLASLAFHGDIVGDYVRRNGVGDLPRPWTSVRGQTEEWFNEFPLAHNLHWSDRSSMAFSIESRVPFLDYRIVEFVFEKANRLSLHDGWTKWIHRAGMSLDDRLPPEVTWRRDKIGFATPEERWVGSSGEELRRVFSAPGAAGEVLDYRRLLDETNAVTPENAALLFRYAALTTWLRLFSERYP